jgi:hypothetical protein
MYLPIFIAILLGLATAGSSTINTPTNSSGTIYLDASQMGGGGPTPPSTADSTLTDTGGENGDNPPR